MPLIFLRIVQSASCVRGTFVIGGERTKPQMLASYIVACSLLLLHAVASLDSNSPKQKKKTAFLCLKS